MLKRFMLDHNLTGIIFSWTTVVCPKWSCVLRPPSCPERLAFLTFQVSVRNSLHRYTPVEFESWWRRLGSTLTSKFGLNGHSAPFKLSLCSLSPFKQIPKECHAHLREANCSESKEYFDAPCQNAPYQNTRPPLLIPVRHPARHPSCAPQGSKFFEKVF